MNESVLTKEILNTIDFQYNNAIPQNYVLPNKVILGENVVKTLMDQNKLSLYLEDKYYHKKYFLHLLLEVIPLHLLTL